jgi:hypothetical protein
LEPLEKMTFEKLITRKNDNPEKKADKPLSPAES